MELRAPREDERGEIRALLGENGLPVDDFDSAAIAFIVAADTGGLTGVVGVEGFGTAGLLRSLAVKAQARGGGTGSMLVEALEAHARSNGMKQLVLLTQTAEAFFAKRGYRATERIHVPEAVRHSGEFRSLCPASAICMTKWMDRP